MKADSNYKICDDCKKIITTHNCSLCNKDLCLACSRVLRNTIYQWHGVLFRFVIPDEHEKKQDRFCKDCQHKITEHKLNPNSMSKFIKNEIITDKL